MKQDPGRNGHRSVGNRTQRKTAPRGDMRRYRGPGRCQAAVGLWPRGDGAVAYPTPPRLPPSPLGLWRTSRRASWGRGSHRRISAYRRISGQDTSVSEDQPTGRGNRTAISGSYLGVLVANCPSAVSPAEPPPVRTTPATATTSTLPRETLRRTSDYDSDCALDPAAPPMAPIPLRRLTLRPSAPELPAREPAS
jgi:hypothetical protein